MGISGSDLAPGYAIFGVMRFGACRFGGHTSDLCLSIDGTELATGRASTAVRVVDGTLSIEDVLNETPNTCQFSVQGFVPTAGMEILIRLGSVNNGTRIFAGHVLRVSQHQARQRDRVTYTVSGIDYTWILQGVTSVNARYLSTSATDILEDLIATFAPAEFIAHVEAGLDDIDEITFTNEAFPTAISRVMDRIGGYWRVDYHKVIRCFTAETGTGGDPIDLTTSHATARDVDYSVDLSPHVNRVIGEGGGVNAATEVAAGATTIPVLDTAWYNAAGGTVVCGPQRITYTGTGAYVVRQNLTWTTPTPISSGQNWYGIAWSPTLAIFVATALDGGTRVMTSPDGVTWTGHTAAEANGWTDVCWADSLGLFVAVAYTGTHRVMTSPDGVNWTARTASEANDWDGICWSPSLGLLVATALSGTHRVMTSPDGVNWTNQTAASAANWGHVCWAETLGLFVAVNRTAGTAGIMTSPDGVTWTGRTTPSATLYGIAWAEELGLLVASNSASGTTVVVTSPDGVTWTARTVDGASGGYNGVAWSADAGCFVTVGTANTVLSSTDGIHWTSEQGPSVTGQWLNVAWAPAIGTFVGIGNSVGSQIMVNSNSDAVFGRLTGVPVSGAGSILYAIKADDEVNLLVIRNNTAAQTALAATLGSGDGVIEDYFQDRRLSEDEAIVRADARLALNATARASLSYASRDQRTAAGKAVTVTLGAPTNLSATLQVQRVAISDFTPHPRRFPTYQVEASSERHTLEDFIARGRTQ